MDEWMRGSLMPETVSVQQNDLVARIDCPVTTSRLNTGGTVHFPCKSPDCQESTRSENRCQVCSLLPPQCHSDSPGLEGLPLMAGSKTTVFTCCYRSSGAKTTIE
ncbi:hypothetical protein ABG768_005270 [Culter alburnus]|uniref:Uncharacterized protein n=1 Tax=Culter alburnus TaxID=194366 RepID=A0AAW1ZRC4_CULAL